MGRKARQAPPRRRRSQRGVLTALGIVFAISAILRLGQLDLAFAEARMPELDHGSPAMTSATQTPLTVGALRLALEDVEALRLRLEVEEAALADRARAVDAAQILVVARLRELEAAEARLSALVATSDQAAADDLDRLTRVYETMDPDEAAALFGEMDTHFGAGFLARMSPAASAAILARLPPDQAYGISVVIATRNASAPRFADDPLPIADGRSSPHP